MEFFEFSEEVSPIQIGDIVKVKDTGGVYPLYSDFLRNIFPEFLPNFIKGENPDLEDHVIKGISKHPYHGVTMLVIQNEKEQVFLIENDKRWIEKQELPKWGDKWDQITSIGETLDDLFITLLGGITKAAYIKDTKFISNNPATVFIGADKTKGVAKVSPPDVFCPETGFKIAFLKALRKTIDKEINRLGKGEK